MIHIIWILSILYRISTYFHFYSIIFPYNIISVVLISLHRTSGPSRCLFFTNLQYFFFLTTDKPLLFTGFISLHCILLQKYGQMLRLFHLRTERCVQFIDIHTTRIFLSRRNYIQDITSWLFIIVLHFVKSFLWYRSVFNQ